MQHSRSSRWERPTPTPSVSYPSPPVIGLWDRRGARLRIRGWVWGSIRDHIRLVVPAAVGPFPHLHTTRLPVRPGHPPVRSYEGRRDFMRGCGTSHLPPLPPSQPSPHHPLASLLHTHYDSGFRHTTCPPSLSNTPPSIPQPVSSTFLFNSPMLNLSSSVVLHYSSSIRYTLENQVYRESLSPHLSCHIVLYITSMLSH
jgi:hypothetical protein